MYDWTQAARGMSIGTVSATFGRKCFWGSNHLFIALSHWGSCIQIFRKNKKYALCILSHYNVNILLFSSLGTCVPVQGCGTILVDDLAGQQTMTRLKCSGFPLYYWVVCMICCRKRHGVQPYPFTVAAHANSFICTCERIILFVF